MDTKQTTRQTTQEDKEGKEEMTNKKKYDIIKNILTNESDGLYTESLKTANTAFAPRQSVFFIPFWGMRAENIQYQPKPLLAAFSESPACSFYRWLTKKANKMTNTIIKKIHELRILLDELYANTESTYIATRCAETRKELAKLSIDILDVDAVLEGYDE